MFPISAFILSFFANFSVLQPHDKYLQLTKREVSLKDTWMRVKERATELRQDRLNTLKKPQLLQRIMMTHKKGSLQHRMRQKQLLGLPYEKTNYL